MVRNFFPLGLQEGGAASPPRLPQHGERGHAGRELLPGGTGLPCAGGLLTGQFQLIIIIFFSLFISLVTL